MGSGLCNVLPVWTQCAINNCGIPPLPAAFTTAAGSFISSILFPSFYPFFISSALFLSFLSLLFILIQSCLSLIFFSAILSFLALFSFPFHSYSVFYLSSLLFFLPPSFTLPYSHPFSFSLLFYFHVLSPFRVFPYQFHFSYLFLLFFFISHVLPSHFFFYHERNRIRGRKSGKITMRLQMAENKEQEEMVVGERKVKWQENQKRNRTRTDRTEI